MDQVAFFVIIYFYNHFCNLGSISKGKVGTADATFNMLDDDFIAMAQGKLNPQQAFMQVDNIFYFFVN